MASELLYLVLTFLTGLWISWSFAEKASLFYTHHTLTAHASSCPLWSAVLILPVFIFARGRHYWLRSSRVNNCQPGAVYPHRDPVLGTDWLTDMKRALKEHKILDLWDSLFKNVGSTFWVQNIGSWVLMTNEPENIKAILATQFDAWPIGGVRQKVSILSLGPHAIFSVNGDEWQHARAMIRPSFVRNQIADLNCTDRHVENFLARVPKDGSTVDLQNLFYLFTMDVSTDFMFGYSTNSLVSPSPEALEFTRSFDYAMLESTIRGRLGWITFLLPHRGLDEAVRTYQRFVDGYIARGLADEKVKERPYLFMSEMLASGASRESVRDQLLSMILGGRDTSASTMSSLFWVLARRPDVYAKLRAEVEGLNGEKPTWEGLRNMRYLNNVLKETLRLWAPVASNSRSASRDTVLPRGGGPDGKSPLFVPKGTACRYSSYSLHRRKDVYGEDANEFRPERWETLRSTWEYIPFSGGPRICIGQQFALTQMSYLIARVLQTFESVEARDDLPMLQKPSTTISLVNGCWVGLKAA